MAMSNIRLANNLGEAVRVYAGGKVFKRKAGQPTTGVVNYTPVSGDVGFYGPESYYYDDMGVLYGTTHNTWTATEIALTYVPGYYGTTGTINVPIGYQEYTILTATVDLRVRYYISYSTRAYYLDEKLDGVYIGSPPVTPITLAERAFSRCVLMNAGQVFSLGFQSSDFSRSYIVNWFWIPEVYTT
jgi:hypothetical protein